MENRKVKFDSHTNLLQLEEHMYPLVDVKTPNVFHNLFPYEEVPKIAFNDRIVPHHMPDETWTTDIYLPRRTAVTCTVHNRTDRTYLDYSIGLEVRKERSVSANFSCTAKKTGMLFTNVWSRVMNFLRSQAGSVPAKRISNWSVIWD